LSDKHRNVFQIDLNYCRVLRYENQSQVNRIALAEILKIRGDCSNINSFSSKPENLNHKRLEIKSLISRAEGGHPGTDKSKDRVQTPTPNPSPFTPRNPCPIFIPFSPSFKLPKIPSSCKRYKA
jgi:hypothetical protein